MDAAETVLDAVRILEGLGYTDDLRLEDGGVQCSACGTRHAPERVVITHTYRFEGVSDPADEAIVLGVECPACGTRGVIVSAYGPEADPALFELLQRLGSD
ncbi:MAG TPA: phosphoribosylpyrophosphate synthetase [Acidimicrobiia bacterium]|nr:phosphoribosylpyrophosphate synthetase [Acidimicrobiia bacterium]